MSAQVMPRLSTARCAGTLPGAAPEIAIHGCPNRAGGLGVSWVGSEEHPSDPEACMAEQTRAVIHFYSTSGEYGCFSNFSRHPVFLKGKRWPTSEHYFQAMKFQGTEHEEKVRLCKTPSAAASMGRSRKLPLRRDWEAVKEAI